VTALTGRTAEQPLVSVVMIFKEAVRFFDEAADSVLRQSWSRLELLLVDDGGTDGTAERARALAARYPDRARVLQHPGGVNRGTGASRLLGIEEARGDLTAFLDADDVWGPDHLAHDVALLMRTPRAGMVCGRSLVWRSWAHSGAQDRLNPLLAAPGVVVDPPDLLAATLRNGALAVPTCSLLVRTEVLRRLGPDVEAFPGAYEDQVLNTLLQLRVPAVVSAAADAFYRQHPHSLTAKMKRFSADAAERRRARRAFVQWLVDQPELAPDRATAEVRALVDRENELQLAAAALHARAVVSRLPPPVRRAASRIKTRLRGPARLDEPTATAAVIRSYAYDLRGDVLGCGEAAQTAVAASPQRVERRTTVDSADPTTLERLLRRERGWDCVLITGANRVPAVLAEALAPGGSLLLAGTAIRPDGLVDRLAAAVPRTCVELREFELGRGRPPLVVARALRPA
jgi:hypothetical protein